LDSVYEDYWASGGQTLSEYVSLRQKVLEDTVGSGKRVLDVGCGDGVSASVLVPHNRVLGVDISETALSKASEKGIKTIKSDLNYGLPPLEGDFDVIILTEVVEHLVNPEKLIDDVVSIMGDDTLLVLSVPNTMNLMNRILFFLGRCVDITDRSHREGKFFSEHLHIFSKKKLENMLAVKKLEVVSRHYYFPPKFSEGWARRLQVLGDVIYKTRLYHTLPSLLSLSLLYTCKKR